MTTQVSLTTAAELVRCEASSPGLYLTTPGAARAVGRPSAEPRYIFAPCDSACRLSDCQTRAERRTPLEEASMSKEMRR